MIDYLVKSWEESDKECLSRRRWMQNNKIHAKSGIAIMQHSKAINRLLVSPGFATKEDRTNVTNKIPIKIKARIAMSCLAFLGIRLLLLV